MADGRALEPSDFQGVTLEQMRGWVESGNGTDSLYGKGDGWKNEDDFMRGLADEVRQRMARAEVTIESRSGEAMQHAVAPAVLWTEITAENASAQAQRMHDQGDAFGRVRSAVPKKAEEAPIPDDCWLEEQWDSLVHGRTDTEAAKAKNEQLRQEAVTGFTSYDDTSRGTVAASAVFTSPPTGGMKIAVGSGPHTPVSPSLPPPRPGDPADTTKSWTEHPGHTPVTEHSRPTPPADTSPTSTMSRPEVPLDRAPNRDVPGPRQPRTWAAMTTSQEVGPRPGDGSGRGGDSGRIGSNDPAGQERGTGGTTNRRGGGVTGRGDSGSDTGRRGGVLSPGGSGGVGGQPVTGTNTGSGSNTSGRGGTVGGAGSTARSARDDRKEEEEEEEHYTPEFLKADHGFFDADLPKVAPPVFGDEDRR